MEEKNKESEWLGERIKESKTKREKTWKEEKINRNIITYMDFISKWNVLGNYVTFMKNIWKSDLSNSDFTSTPEILQGYLIYRK